jgi:tetratricopeptide (TPR) repeat protein
MKNKSKRILSSLVVLGLTAGVGAARADQAEVARVEKELESYAADKDPNARYTGHLYYLAGVYRQNGMRQKSDAAFNKFLQLWRRKPQGESEASLMLGWANSMTVERREFSYPNGTSEEAMERDQERDKIEHKQDLVRAAKIADDALAMASKTPPTSEEKIKVLFSAASVYESTNSIQKKQQVLSELDRTFRTMEQNKSLTAGGIINLANHLVAMSDLYSSMNTWRQTMMQKPVGLLPDSAPKDTYGVRERDFKIGEAYRLRAMAQFEKLPARDPSRINAQRSLVAWYRLYGQDKKYNAALQKLGTLLGSTDQNVLFPLPRPCPGCGRG